MSKSPLINPLDPMVMHFTDQLVQNGGLTAMLNQFFKFDGNTSSSIRAATLGAQWPLFVLAYLQSGRSWDDIHSYIQNTIIPMYPGLAQAWNAVQSCKAISITIANNTGSTSSMSSNVGRSAQLEVTLLEIDDRVRKAATELPSPAEIADLKKQYPDLDTDDILTNDQAELFASETEKEIQAFIDARLRDVSDLELAIADQKENFAKIIDKAKSRQLDALRKKTSAARGRREEEEKKKQAAEDAKTSLMERMLELVTTGTQQATNKSDKSGKTDKSKPSKSPVKKRKENSEADGSDSD